MTDHVHKATDQRIFVFGSNLKGIHGGGAAWYLARLACHLSPEGRTEIMGLALAMVMT